MPSKALICANDLIKRANDEGVYLPRTKLLKLIYFMFGHYLAKIGEELFEEKFQAWQYGPVVTKVYNKTKKMDIVDKLLEDSDGLSYGVNPETEYGKKYFEVLDYVWNKYSKFSSTSLTSLSHAKGSPWDVTYHQKGEYQEIDNDLIKRYFLGEPLIRRDA